MLQQGVPVVLHHVDAHGQHYGHGVVDSLDAAIGAGVVRGGVDLVNTNAFVEGVGGSGGKLQAVIRDERDEASQRGMYWSTRMSAVPAAVNWATVTG